MSEIITLEEAKVRYPEEWVVLENPEVDETGVPIRGRLAFHSTDRSAAHRRIGKYSDNETAVFFTGKLSGRYVL